MNQRVYGRQPINPVLGCPVYLGDCSQAGLDIAVAGGLATPGAAIYIRCAIDDADDGVVIIHQVAARQVPEPHAYLGALACAALGDERIAIAVLSDKRGVDKQGVLLAGGKGVGQHQGIVEAIAAHVVVAIEGTATYCKVVVGNEQAAALLLNILDDKLVAAVGAAVYDDVTVACVKGMYAGTLLLGDGLQTIVDGKLEQGVVWVMGRGKRGKRWQERNVIKPTFTEDELNRQVGQCEPVDSVHRYGEYLLGFGSNLLVFLSLLFSYLSLLLGHLSLSLGLFGL